MIDLGQFHFIRPLWLMALAPLFILLWLLATRKIGSRSWESVCDEELLPYILIGRSPQNRRWSIGLIGVCGLLAILALAGPTWERLPQPVYSGKSALVIALDLSLSMEATDIKPSRLERARFKIADLLNLRKEGQTALLVYAGDAFVVAPLTNDTRTIASQLPVLSTSIMPSRGSDSGRALERAGELLSQGGSREGHILLVTDEIDMAVNRSTINQLRKQGYRISVLGVGTGEGSPITMPDGGFIKDASGSIVIPKLDSNVLLSAAREGGGIYREIRMDDTDINALSGFFASGPLTEGESTPGFETDVWREQGPWLILVLLPLAALSFRRGYLLLLFSLLLPIPEQARAFEWRDLWLNADQQGMQALDAGEPEKAAGLFRDPGWKAAARYRAGDFPAAGEILEKLDDAEGNYNRGNALARQGRYQDAIAAYDQALALMPGHEDARYNRELVAKELQQQKQSSPSSSDDQQQQSSGQQQQDGDNDEKGSSQESKGDDMNDNREGKSSAAEQLQGQQDQTSSPEQKERGQEQPQDADQPVTQSTAGENDGQDSASAGISKDDLPDEETLAEEQWLRRIPDDPGGLLRRKFQYQYQRQSRGPSPDGKDW